MKSRDLTTVIALTILSISCVDEIELATGSDAGILVVEGLITTEFEHCRVRISRALPFDSDKLVTAYYVPEQNATVEVVDLQGETHLYQEAMPGIYVPSDTQFRGKTGRSYFLKFTTGDGRSYTSDPEQLFVTPDIDSIGVQFVNRQRISSTGTIVTDEAFEISVLNQDPAPEQNFYRWKFSGVMEYYSLTENPAIQTCWANFPDLEDGIQISHDGFYNGNIFSQSLGFVPYQKPTRFMITVSQFTMSEQAFFFWQLTKKQQENTGSIFDTLPAKITGNVYNTLDAEEQVLGYFGASDVKIKSIVFDQFKTSRFKAPSRLIPALQGDCREHPPFGSNTKPRGF